MTNVHEVKGHFRRLASVLSVVWAAGTFGGLVNWLIGPLFESLRLLEFSHVDLHYSLNRGSLFSALTLGGVWGLIFLLTLPRQWGRIAADGHWQFWVRAFFYGLIPALVEIFFILPHDGHGIGGTGYGAATWVYVILFNTLGWSLPAYFWVYLIGPSDNSEGFGYDALAGNV